jgi:hypothetical protein
MDNPNPCTACEPQKQCICLTEARIQNIERNFEALHSVILQMLELIKDIKTTTEISIEKSKKH